MIYIPNLIKPFHTFKQVLNNAIEWFESQPEKKRTKLESDLEHGAAILTNKEQLKPYLAKYGKIHQDKLLQAFEQIPDRVWDEENISIIDYGCGQGIAEMVLSDYLTARNVDNDYIKDFILIDPSEANLNQCEQYVERFYNNAEIITLCKTEKCIDANNIAPKAQTVIHILSNVIDLEDFSGDNIADLLSSDKSHNNIVVCVSPYYQESSRGKQMTDFGKKLIGYTLVYKLEKHITDWAKPYSCQIHIYISSYY